jgi:mannose-1-phosphate guanylyltransferase/mannose-1-phosphate guanylyltransferase/mannose-6-phosphate isomerase
MSTPERPKQLIAVTGEKSLLQLTATRAVGPDYRPPILVANAAHAGEIERQLAEAGAAAETLILEPEGRNTAPAIALAALAAGGGEAMLLVMPSDHLIADVPAFLDAVRKGLALARTGWLVTFGLAPTGPETGYGYIRKGEALGDGVMRADRFVEKPPLAVAKAMAEDGGHVWNGGIFLFRADAFLAALADHAPAVLDACTAAMAAARTEGTHVVPDRKKFAVTPAISIDHAVMEHADKVAVVPVAMGWSDVGSWDSLYETCARDAEGNALQGDVVALDAQRCLIRSDGIRVSAVGVKDLIIVANGDEVLIVPRGRSQEIRKLVPLLGDRRQG